jgi:hypothetical protein
MLLTGFILDGYDDTERCGPIPGALTDSSRVVREHFPEVTFIDKGTRWRHEDGTINSGWFCNARALDCVVTMNQAVFGRLAIMCEQEGWLSLMW